MPRMPVSLGRMLVASVADCRNYPTGYAGVVGANVRDATATPRYSQLRCYVWKFPQGILRGHIELTGDDTWCS